jgi:hypothetical protein
MSLCVNEKKATSAPDNTKDKKNKSESTIIKTVVPCACSAANKLKEESNSFTG